jgi:O-succinylbenzoate synthase
LGFDVWVIKPAIEDPKLILRTAANHMERVVFTSYLDHPVGQVFAAWSAAQALDEHPLLVDICGLLSHRVYEPNKFSEQLSGFGPAFAVPKGTGCGFNEELAALPWKKLEN